MTIQKHVGGGIIEGIRAEFGGSRDTLQMVFVRDMLSGPLDAPDLLCAGSILRDEWTNKINGKTSHILRGTVCLRERN